MRVAIVSVLAVLVGCSGSSSSPGPAGDADVDSTTDSAANEAGGDDSSVDETSGGDTFTPPDTASHEIGPGDVCFGTSTATETSCKTACMPYGSCTLSSGGTCATNCATHTAIVESCAKAAMGDCISFKGCVECALVCEKADTCPGSLSAGTCCGNCIARPECWDPSLPTCDAIKRATVGCPPKMM